MDQVVESLLREVSEDGLRLGLLPDPWRHHGLLCFAAVLQNPLAFPFVLHRGPTYRLIQQLVDESNTDTDAIHDAAQALTLISSLCG